MYIMFEEIFEAGAILVVGLAAKEFFGESETTTRVALFLKLVGAGVVDYFGEKYRESSREKLWLPALSLVSAKKGNRSSARNYGEVIKFGLTNGAADKSAYTAFAVAVGSGVYSIHGLVDAFVFVGRNAVARGTDYMIRDFVKDNFGCCPEQELIDFRQYAGYDKAIYVAEVNGNMTAFLYAADNEPGYRRIRVITDLFRERPLVGEEFRIRLRANESISEAIGRAAAQLNRNNQNDQNDHGDQGGQGGGDQQQHVVLPPLDQQAGPQGAPNDARPQ